MQITQRLINHLFVFCFFFSPSLPTLWLQTRSPPPYTPILSVIYLPKTRKLNLTSLIIYYYYFLNPNRYPSYIIIVNLARRRENLIVTALLRINNYLFEI